MRVTEPNNAVTEYQYDPNGNLVLKVLANGLTTRYRYNGLDLVVEELKVRAGDAMSRKMVYDSVGNLIAISDSRKNISAISYYTDGSSTCHCFITSSLCAWWRSATVLMAKSFRDGMDEIDRSERSSDSSSSSSSFEGTGDAIENVYDSIKKLPNYPEGFNAVKNGTTKNTIKNKQLLEQLRKVEPGTWKKIYKDGYDAMETKNPYIIFKVNLEKYLMLR